MQGMPSTLDQLIHPEVSKPKLHRAVRDPLLATDHAGILQDLRVVEPLLISSLDGEHRAALR